VAKTYLLDGKEVTITIKEKEAFLMAANADFTVVEAKENGAELTTLKATVEKGIAKVKIKLRPKADETLTTWKEKLANGKEDGTHQYDVKSFFIVFGDLDKVAGNIERKSNEALAPNHVVKKADISKLLKEGGTYTTGNSFVFPKYKKEKVVESLWLKAECQGTKKHEGEFLKKDGEYFTLAPAKLIIFPTIERPINDSGLEWEERYWAETKKDNVVCFGAARTGRKHAARDLYTDPSTTIVAIADGKVIGKNKYFGANDVYVSVLHKLSDGRKFIVKYCELAKSSVSLKINDDVEQGQELGKTAHLGVSAYNRKEKKNYSLYMCHFEVYDCSAGEDNPLYMNNPPYMRRKDLIDPLPILREGYRNTFGVMGEGNDHLFTLNDGKEALTTLYNKYKDKTWNWIWNGSDKTIEVTGKDVLIIVEKMYRLETTHFKSEQYQNCGTGGMESFGDAPYYGWDSTLFTEQPVGTWSAFEGAGLSGKGGNAQDTIKKKVFVKLSSVVVGMEYKIKYIIKYDGNYARWFNKSDQTAQKAYEDSLVGVKARIVEEL
jgi:hypothetical protein